MKEKDVARAVRVIASDARQRQRYGTLLEQLPSVWLNLLQRECIKAIVMEDLDAPGTRFLGVGVSAFITSEFLQAFKMGPLLWMGPELVRRITTADAPLLNPRAVRTANSADGLNVFVWGTDISEVPESDRGALSLEMMRAYIQEHSGFQIKEMLAQPSDPFVLQVQLRTGAFLWDVSAGKWVSGDGADIEKLIDRPFLVGVTRDLAEKNVGTWVSEVFKWTPPRIGFAPSEQRLVVAALQGLTDDELSNDLMISHSAVKNAWRSIYARVAGLMPGLLPDTRTSNRDGNERGKQKRQRLLAYLRERPEELRPFVRKLIAERRRVAPAAPSKRRKAWLNPGGKGG
jgi:hypothetical protein